MQVLPVPDGVDLVTAGGLPEVVCTVWSNVVLTGRLAAGETFLVQGGSSGIGATRSRSRRRWARGWPPPPGHRTGRTLPRAWCRHRHRLPRRRPPTELQKATDGHGADVILDNMGAKGLAANVDALAADGRLMIIGMQGGTKADLDLSKLLRRRRHRDACAGLGRGAERGRARSWRGCASRSGR